MKISIVMTYYNRRKLLINTLHSITKSNYKGQLEIVIVNDASDDNIDDINAIFPSLDFKIINIKKSDKWWTNPCIPNNVGFYVASGDVIIIQNPECLHTGDIISNVELNIKNNKYLVLSCYSVCHDKTNLISKININLNTTSYFDAINNIILPINPNKWYQHSVFRPGEINFCTAIMKNDLKDLGGFDERFAKGIAKDDREFILRIRKKNMDIELIDSPFVIHQWHGCTDYSNKKLVDRNNKLFCESKKSNEYKVNNSLTKDLIGKLGL